MAGRMGERGPIVKSGGTGQASPLGDSSWILEAHLQDVA
jgi:hypothetical protein